MMLTYCAIFPNGKKYIGVTSCSIEKRISEHRSACKKVNNKFYRALNKYGFDNVEFRIIKYHETKEEMFDTEKILIHRHKTNIIGYNTTIGGEGAIGLIYTEEIRKNISISQIRRFSNPEQVNIARNNTMNWIKNNPDKHLKLIEKRNSILRSDKHRINARNKQLAYLKRNPNARKAHSIRMTNLYKDNDDLKIRISRTLGGRPINMFKNGIFIKKFETLQEIRREYGLNISNVTSVLKGKRNHVHGYTFEKV